MDIDTIRAVQDCGFSVYMRNPNDRYCYFTDGTNIGYLQFDRFEGFSLSTVHMPNTTTGTGFRIDIARDAIDCATLQKAFAHSPQWADKRERDSVRKYRDMAHFLDDAWNATLKPIDCVS